MMNLNDTISAFRCCTSVPSRCSKCPLTEMCKWSLSRDRCKTEVKLSVNHWLKAQEPRVMTLEEVVALQEGKGDVWIEITAMPGIPPWIIAATLTEKTDWQELGALWFSDDQCHYVTDYNLNTADGWRCWTSRPTEAEREATPWKT